MRQLRNFAAGLSLAVLAAPSCVAAATMHVPQEVTAAITAVVADEVAAWNRGDAAAFAALAADDVVFTNIVGLFAVGRAPFEAQHARIFATIYQGSTMAQQIEHIALVRPGVAVVDTVTGISGFKALSPGVVGDGGVLRTRLEQVLVRDDAGRWRVAAYHNVTINAAALAAMPK